MGARSTLWKGTKDLRHPSPSSLDETIPIRGSVIKVYRWRTLLICKREKAGLTEKLKEKEKKDREQEGGKTTMWAICCRGDQQITPSEENALKKVSNSPHLDRGVNYIPPGGELAPPKMACLGHGMMARQRWRVWVVKGGRGQISPMT